MVGWTQAMRGAERRLALRGWATFPVSTQGLESDVAMSSVSVVTNALRLNHIEL